MATSTVSQLHRAAWCQLPASARMITLLAEAAGVEVILTEDGEWIWRGHQAAFELCAVWVRPIDWTFVRTRYVQSPLGLTGQARRQGDVIELREIQFLDHLVQRHPVARARYLARVVTDPAWARFKRHVLEPVSLSDEPATS